MQAMTSAYVAAPRIVEERCHVCRQCVARQACRTRAITSQDPGEPPFIDASRCYGCRVCVKACPFEAIVA
jgi:Pyruvate/2-oxoacid:ferredoxin oxidoreductase delta subunit